MSSLRPRSDLIRLRCYFLRCTSRCSALRWRARPSCSCCGVRRRGSAHGRHWHAARFGAQHHDVLWHYEELTRAGTARHRRSGNGPARRLRQGAGGTCRIRPLFRTRRESRESRPNDPITFRPKTRKRSCAASAIQRQARSIANDRRGLTTALALAALATRGLPVLARRRQQRSARSTC